MVHAALLRLGLCFDLEDIERCVMFVLPGVDPSQIPSAARVAATEVVGEVRRAVLQAVLEVHIFRRVLWGFFGAELNG